MTGFRDIPVFDSAGQRDGFARQYDTAGGVSLPISKEEISGKIEFVETESINIGENIKIQDLYSDPKAVRPEISNAIILLTEANDLANEALSLFKADDIFNADDAVNRLLALLPELFCCRELGDGFGAMVNALFQGIKNLEGEPLNEMQIQATKLLINRLLNEPFLPFESALEEIEKLEESGFSIDAKNLSLIEKMSDE